LQQWTRRLGSHDTPPRHACIAFRFLLLRAAPGKYEPHLYGAVASRSSEAAADSETQREGAEMEVKSTRRIVTGHDASGKAVALFDAALPATQRGSNGMTLLWVTSEFPVDMTSAADRARTAVGVPPPADGTIFRIVDFAPVSSGGGTVDHHQILISMGIDPATQGYARHANTHRTRTIDYALVLDGEIDMLLDDSEVHVKAGDMLVQQGTNHAWVNNGTKPCRIAFILIDAKTPPAWQKRWKP
jgi:mannose-6-phosphate isomerase-like protein (cupin superfamily)